MHVWYRMMIWYAVPIVLTCNTAACCLGAESSVFCIALSCAVKKYAYRPVPSWKKNVPSRVVEKNVVSSLPVVEEIIYRPVPSSKKLCAVLSHREKKYKPFRSVVTIFIFRPVPSWQFLLTVQSRHETKASLYCTVPSRQGNSHPPSCPVPSRQL